jgi:expansin (peptidoglycan-binding protein)
VTGSGNRLRRVSVRVGGGWRSLTRTDYNYWIAQSGLGRGPFTLRVEDVEGHRVSVPGVRLAPGVLQRTSVRMY